MLEHARRQVVLVLLVATAALFSAFGRDFIPGLDLSGGSQLIYEIDLEELGGPDRPEGVTDEQIVEETRAVVAQRIDPTGTRQVGVVQRGARQLLIEMPDVTRSEREDIERRIGQLGRLELRLVVDRTEIDGEPFSMDEEKSRVEQWLARDDNREKVSQNPSHVEVFNGLTRREGGPVSDLLRWYPAVMDRAADGSWSRPYSVSARLTGHRAYQFAVPAFDNSRWLEGSEPNPAIAQDGAFLVDLLPITMQEPWFSGEDMDAPRCQAGWHDGAPCVFYAVQPHQAGAYGDWSGANVDHPSAIILNGVVKTAPTFDGRIPGKGLIHGSFTERETRDLARVIKTGSLRIIPRKVSGTTIGPRLGADSIRRGILSVAVGGVAILLFVLAYYRVVGLVAFCSIAFNVLLILGAVNFLRATLTLPGLAGLVLTIGMAIDANILIFERIREERSRGKDLTQAVRSGFTQAMVTILDANITTFIAGVVLYNVGVGPIRGFAVTLMIGIATTLFTAFFVSRLAFHYLLKWRSLPDLGVVSRLAKLRINFVAAAKPAFALSLVTIVAGLALVFAAVPANRALGLDFTGGADLRVAIQDPMTRLELVERLRADASFHERYPTPVVNTVGEVVDGKARTFSVRIKLTPEQREEILADRRAAEASGIPFIPPYQPLIGNALEDVLRDSAFGELSAVPHPERSAVQLASAEVRFAAPVDPAALQAQLQSKLSDTTAVTRLEPDAFLVELQLDGARGVDQLPQLIRAAARGVVDLEGRAAELPEPVSAGAEIGTRMVADLRNAAIGALVLALLLIVAYIRIRFREYKYGFAAVAALLHDLLIALVVIALCNHFGLVHAELDLPMIAAFLTIIGYSINDTIVIFDRVRENLDAQRRLGGRPAPFAAVLNRSINQTLSRTILTSSTTLFVVLAQLVVNYGSGTSLEGFSFALLIGVVAGTYSTVFIATPVVLWLRNRETARIDQPIPLAIDSPRDAQIATTSE